MSSALLSMESFVTPLGDVAIDEMHEEFACLLEQAKHVADDQMPAMLRQIASHCGEHFALEEELMQRYDYPGRDCHAREHAAVLASVAGVTRKMERGELAPAKILVRSLAQWFPAHSQHLDSALAHWMSKRRWGGKPVVFHVAAAKA